MLDWPAQTAEHAYSGMPASRAFKEEGESIGVSPVAPIIDGHRRPGRRDQFKQAFDGALCSFTVAAQPMSDCLIQPRCSVYRPCQLNEEGELQATGFR